MAARAAHLLLMLPLASAQLTLQIVARYPAGNLVKHVPDLAHRSAALGLSLRGNFSGLSWDVGIPMSAAGDDTFVAQLDVAPDAACGILQYKVLVEDQVWQVGANAQVTFPFCTSASSARAGSFATTVYPWFGTQNGRYEYTYGVYSPQLGNVRDIVTYLPPSYDENPYKLFDANSVLIMHDGQNLFNASTSAFGVAWMCQDTIDALVPEGAMREIIIVGVDNTDARIYEYTYSIDPTVGQGGGADVYLDFLQQTVLPLAQTRYRIVPTPQQRWGILGSSLGGLLSCYAGWTRPSLWGLAGCMSSSFWWNNEDFNSTILPRHANATYPPVVSVYLDSGDAGPDNDDMNQTRTVRNRMEALGLPLLPVVPSTIEWDSSLGYYLDHGGQHSESYWGARFHVPMRYGFPPSVDVATAL